MQSSRKHCIDALHVILFTGSCGGILKEDLEVIPIFSKDCSCRLHTQGQEQHTWGSHCQGFVTLLLVVPIIFMSYRVGTVMMGPTVSVILICKILDALNICYLGPGSCPCWVCELRLVSYLNCAAV